jgi:predicted secreted protein
MSTPIVSLPTVEMEVDNIFIIDQTAKQQFEKTAIRRLVRKLDRRIIPFMCILEAASYLNRVSIGTSLLLR